MTGHKAEQKVGLKVPRLHFKLLNHYKYTQIDKQRENIVGGKKRGTNKQQEKQGKKRRKSNKNRVHAESILAS